MDFILVKKRVHRFTLDGFSEVDLLDEDPVHEDQGEGDYQEDVGEVEHELWDIIFSAESYDIPVGYSHLK